jgi:hypothetical protein
VACLIGCDVRPEVPGDDHVTESSETAMRKNTFIYRKRAFLNSISTGHTSYVLAEVESSDNGGYQWGTNMVTIADCGRMIHLEFFLGTLRSRRQSLAKINLLIDILTRFRDALTKESDLIEKRKKVK